MAGRGSRFHAALDSRRWQVARRQCFALAGYRCSRCGRAGRLECHHRKPLQHGGEPFDQANLECLCRRCHVEHHRREHDVPGRAEWRALVAEIANT